MKKVFFLIALMAIMAGCGSNEQHISGTSLFTYKKGGKVGVKGYYGPSEEEKIILPADFISAEAYSVFLFMQTGDSPETYKIYWQDGNPALKPEIKILKKTENYRIIAAANNNNGKAVIFSKRSDISAYEEIYTSENLIFCYGNKEKWNVINAETSHQSILFHYDKIIVIRDPETQKTSYFGWNSEREKWEIKYGNDPGFPDGSCSDADFRSRYPNLPKAKETFANGMVTIYEYHN
jgi:hypothetical protein